jgi:predicted deacylase
MKKAIYLLAKGTSHETKYHVITAQKKGPVCMVTAGIHGNEIAAPIMAEQLPRTHLHTGTLVIVPIVNQQAYRARVRGNPDVNRAFPRTLNDSSRHPIASELIPY